MKDLLPTLFWGTAFLLGQSEAQGVKNWVCKDTLPDNGCAKFDAKFCDHFYHANYQCPKTCGKCEGDPLRPINTVGVCYRDSPCNEEGTDGGNKNGCSLTELYPFFKCKCKPLWDGYRCQWFNCPCQNGGKCRPCLRGKCVDQPKCSCPNGFKGPMCQTPVPTKRPTTTSMPKTTTARTTTPRITTPRTTTPKQTRPTKPPRPTLPAQWGPWSAWTECNDSNNRTRQRFCSDKSTIRARKCCLGMKRACKKLNMLPDAFKPQKQTVKCTSAVQWSEWSRWSKVCNRKTAGLKTYRTRVCNGGKAKTSYGCHGGPPFRRQVKRCPFVTNDKFPFQQTNKDPITDENAVVAGNGVTGSKGGKGKGKGKGGKGKKPTSRSGQDLINEFDGNPVVMANDFMSPTSQEVPEVPEEVPEEVSEMINDPMAALMDSLPELPSGIESSIDWNNLNETLAGNPFPPPGVASGMMMGGLPWSTSTPNGAPVTNANIHFHFQCWPQCLGLRRPYLCIVPQWCAKEYYGKRTFWMWN